MKELDQCPLKVEKRIEKDVRVVDLLVSEGGGKKGQLELELRRNPS